MNRFWHRLGAASIALAMVGGFGNPAFAVDRFTVNVLNEREFTLSIEIRDKVCGGGVLLRDRIEAGESRAIEICANPEGLGALRATYGSGCSQVKKTEFLDIQPGDIIGF